MNNKFYIGKKVSSFEDYNHIGPITGISLVVDEENEYRAGNDSGYVIEVDCPYGTQSMADNILASLKNYTYKGFRARDAELDMEAELGDGVTVNGIYSMLAYRNLTFGPGHMSEIAAPGESELEHEYPYITSTQRNVNRKIASTRSLITKTAEEIRLEVTKGLDGLSSELSVKLAGITARVDGLDGAYSELKITVDGVTITDSSGSTLIKGASIDTSTIKANSIQASAVNLSGSITFNDLTNEVQNDINDAWSMAYSAQDVAEEVEERVSGWTYRGTTFIDGGMIMADTVMASILKGGTVQLLTSSDLTAGSLSITGSSSSSYAIDLSSGGALRLTAQNGSVYIESDESDLQLDSLARFGGITELYASTDGHTDLGTSSHNWKDLYVANDPIVASDLNIKHGVEYGLSAYNSFFDSLRPMSFLFNEGSSGRRHCGLGAQDVEQCLLENGISTFDFAGFIKSPKRNKNTGEIIEGEYSYALRYGEFIAMNIWQIQEIKKRLTALEKNQ